jgi:hypothetical protein
MAMWAIGVNKRNFAGMLPLARGYKFRLYIGTQNNTGDD